MSECNLCPFLLWGNNGFGLGLHFFGFEIGNDGFGLHLNIFVFEFSNTGFQLGFYYHFGVGNN